MLSRVRGANLGLVFLIGFLIWLLNHPYLGIWHDARIYALLAAHWITPEAYADDLFFRFGSQGDFTLFTVLFGSLISQLGLSLAAWWVTVAGAMLWIGACIVLARTFLGTGTAACFAVVLGAVAETSYSPNGGTFILGEPFATARIIAIPFGMFSVAALAARRQAWALGFALASTAMHPLNGIWPLALWVLARTGFRMALGLVLLPLGTLVLLGLINVNLPYLRLMSGDWLTFAREIAPDVVFKELLHTRIVENVGVLLALWLGARMGSEKWRDLYLRLLLLGLGGLGLALIASYAFPLEIVVQGQPWRVMALLMPMAVVAVLDISQRGWQSSRMGRMLISAAVIVISMDSSLVLGLLYGTGVLALMPSVQFARFVARVEPWLERWQHWVEGGLAALALVALPNILANWELLGRKFLNPWWGGSEWLHGLVAGNNWHLAVVAALVFWGWRKVSSGTEVSIKGLSLASSGVVAALGLASLLALSAWDRYFEHSRGEQACYLSKTCPPHPLRKWVMPGDTVFWPDHELSVWFELWTASYFGKVQATGNVFSSAKFFEWQRRDALVAGGTDPYHLCVDPILDWVVLPYAVQAGTARGVWRNWHLYACPDFRAVSRKGASFRASLAPTFEALSA